MKKYSVTALFIFLLLLLTLPTLCFAEGDDDYDLDLTSPITGQPYLNGYIPTITSYGDKNNTYHWAIGESWMNFHGGADWTYRPV
ncbi:hypothetical protein F9B85_06395 [Heliorestis acidaminivorans]|uniref:Uncharacterized protein n=1 Tax=Heliorestis acidaminivorans TaxID=553427 RepID=A0A6I0ESM0_9FIRM|nr:hypothetical protein [Heliorestis acidaminivorans]KAB2952898.1 hypothetical protein F9B85_06395 [Heliorestis acidaminivorans]